MAKAYQCDRCQQYYTENKEIPMGGTDKMLCGVLYKIRLADGTIRDGRYYELCDDCLKKVKDFMDLRADVVSKENKIQ